MYLFPNGMILVVKVFKNIDILIGINLVVYSFKSEIDRGFN